MVRVHIVSISNNRRQRRRQSVTSCGAFACNRSAQKAQHSARRVYVSETNNGKCASLMKRLRAPVVQQPNKARKQVTRRRKQTIWRDSAVNTSPASKKTWCGRENTRRTLSYSKIQHNTAAVICPCEPAQRRKQNKNILQSLIPHLSVTQTEIGCFGKWKPHCSFSFLCLRFLFYFFSPQIFVLKIWVNTKCSFTNDNFIY